MSEGTEDVEGQVYILRVPKPGDRADDVEGHRTGCFLEPDDTEGQVRLGRPPVDR